VTGPIDPRYPYVAVEVAADEAEVAGALLFELGAQGVEERDATTLSRGGSAGKVTLVAGFENHDDARRACDGLPPAWSPRLEEIVGDAWRDEWKKHFEPFRICDGVVVRPPWRDYAPEAGEQVIVLEPGRAFGTGLHETTSLVAEVLASVSDLLRGGSDASQATVLDVGCGSGILAIVALALGARSARAIDVDPDAAAVTRENAERNGMSSRIVADETPVERVGGRYPVVLANIEATTLIALAPALLARVATGGVLVLSGVLAPEVAPTQLEDLRRAYRTLSLVDVRKKGEWIALVMRAAASPTSA
jgi:ribosomal protein L11 methyltransferase